MDYSLNDAAVLLGVATTTLRVWCAQIAPLLSDTARDCPVHPRFTEADMALLHEVQKLMHGGRSYNHQLYASIGNWPGDHAAGLDAPESRMPAVAAPEETRLGGIPSGELEATLAQAPVAAVREHEPSGPPVELPPLQPTLLLWGDWLQQFSLTRLLLIPLIGVAVVLAAIGLVWLLTPRALGNVVGAPVAPATAAPPTAVRETVVPTLLPPAASGLFTPLPTAPATPAAALPAGSSQPNAMFQPISAAEAELRTGQIEASLEDQNGERSLVHMRFDLGDAQHAPRLQSTTIYTSAAGIQADEWILIGDQAWQRQAGGHWSIAPEKSDILEQIRAFLPHLTTALDPALEQSGDGSTTTLHWYDTAADANITLQIDSATGIPRALRKVARDSGATLVVTYQSWNTPVEIDIPAAE